MREIDLHILIEYGESTKESEKYLNVFFSHLKQVHNFCPSPDIYQGTDKLLLCWKKTNKNDLYCILEFILCRCYRLSFSIGNRSTSVIFSHLPSEECLNFLISDTVQHWDVYLSEDIYSNETGNSLSAIKQSCICVKTQNKDKQMFSSEEYSKRKLNFRNTLSVLLEKERLPSRIYEIQLWMLSDVCEDSGSVNYPKTRIV